MTEDQTLTVLRQEVACYGRLAKLTGLQHQLVQQNRTEELLEVLKGRQEVLNNLAGLNARLGAAKTNWSGYLESLDPPARIEAQSLLDQTRQLLQEITTADRNDALVLQQRKLSVGNQIRHAIAAKQVNRQYAAAAYGAATARMDVGG